MIRFTAEPIRVAGRTILRLPETASKQLPSRGQVAVAGSVNGHPLTAIIEPDGDSGHWMNVSPEWLDDRDANSCVVEFDVSGTWPEPDVPDDLRQALAAAPPDIRDMWTDITPMARWEWVRWVNATRNPETRQRRVEVTISKMQAGKRRPCCFNLAGCTDPELTKNGRLDVSRAG